MSARCNQQGQWSYKFRGSAVIQNLKKKGISNHHRKLELLPATKTIYSLFSVLRIPSVRYSSSLLSPRTAFSKPEYPKASAQTRWVVSAPGSPSNRCVCGRAFALESREIARNPILTLRIAAIDRLQQISGQIAGSKSTREKLLIKSPDDVSFARAEAPPLRLSPMVILGSASDQILTFTTNRSSSLPLSELPSPRAARVPSRTPKPPT
jgi:hypothetical protein